MLSALRHVCLSLIIIIIIIETYYDAAQQKLFSPFHRPTAFVGLSGMSIKFSPERDYVTFGSLLSQIRLSYVMLVRPT